MSNDIVNRDWGYWKVIAAKEPRIKIKELVIDPHGSLSYQRHFARNEHWFVLTGSVKIITSDNRHTSERIYSEFETIVIPKGTWHQAINCFDEPVSILEVQYGELCIEEDIERKNHV